MGLAMGVDRSGNLYMIDEELLAKHGKKVPKNVAKGKIDVKMDDLSAFQADVAGQGQDSWLIWYAST